MPAKESKELSPEGLMQLLTQAAAIIHEEAVRIVQPADSYIYFGVRLISDSHPRTEG